MRAAVVGLVGLALVLAGCGGGSGDNSTPVPGGDSVLNWDRSPDAVVIRLDRLVLEEADVDKLNRLPACTLFGDGHVVWVNVIPPQGEEVLESRIDEVAVRQALEFVVRDLQFYEVPDYAASELPPSTNAVMETISLAINGEVRTVRSYRPWPQETYLKLLERCRTLSSQPVLFAPTGAWVSAYEVPRRSEAIVAYWSEAAPFSMIQMAETNTAFWLTASDALGQLWNKQRETLGQINWLENGRAFRVAIQVPGISRSAPPVPAATATPSQ